MKQATLIVGSLFFGLTFVGSSVLSVRSSRALAQAAETSDVSELIKALSDQNGAKRWRAARDLGTLGPRAKAALPALVQALQDNNPAVRQYAAVAIGRLGDVDDDVVKKLIAAVGDSDSRVRVAAAISIRQLINDPAVVIPMAVKMMEEPLFASRMIETVVLRGENAIPFLLAALENERAAYWACLAIEEMGEAASPTVPALIKLLDSGPDDSLKLQALLAIAKIGPQAAPAKEQVLAALGAGSSDTVLTGAAFAAGVLGFREASARLEQTRESDDPLLRMVSLWALAKLHPDDAARQQTAIDHLIEGLGSDDATMRLAAAEGLNELDLDPDIIGPKLIHLLDDADPIVAHNLVETFASLGEAAAERAGRALANEELRDLAVRVLDRLGPKASVAVPHIVDALSGAKDDFRLQLQSVIRQIGPDAAAATEELVRSLNDASEETRVSALLALGYIGPGAAAAKSKVLPTVDSSQDPFERVLSAWVVAKIAPTDKQAIDKVVPVLIKGLHFPDGLVQAESAMTLGELGPAARSAADELEALAARKDVPAELGEIANEAATAVRQ